MELVATERGVRLRDLGSRNGTFIGDTRVGEVFITKHAYVALGDAMVEFSPSVPHEVEVPELGGFGPLVGASAGMRTVFERLKKAAPTDLTVLVTGETGTGKELVAQAIHENSPRTAAVCESSTSVESIVVCVDTSVAHLAATLGRPTYILLPHLPDWRWLLDRPDSPWYPTARLVRQGRSDDWDDVISRVAAHIRDAIAAGGLPAGDAPP